MAGGWVLRAFNHSTLNITSLLGRISRWEDKSYCKEFFDSFASARGLNPNDPTTWLHEIKVKDLMTTKVALLCNNTSV